MSFEELQQELAAPLEELEAYLARHASTLIQQNAPALDYRNAPIRPELVEFFRAAYLDPIIAPEQLRLLEHYLPLNYQEAGWINNRLADYPGAMVRVSPYIAFWAALWDTSNRIGQDVENGRELDELDDRRAMAMARQLPIVTRWEVIRAAELVMFGTVSVLLERSPFDTNDVEVGPVIRRAVGALGGSPYAIRILERLLQQGYPLPRVRGVRDALARIGAASPAALEEASEDSREFFRFLYVLGHGALLPGWLQIAILSGRYAWLVVTHPEVWTVTEPRLVREAEQALAMMRAGLGAVLPPALVRYVLRKL